MFSPVCQALQGIEHSPSVDLEATMAPSTHLQSRTNCWFALPVSLSQVTPDLLQYPKHPVWSRAEAKGPWRTSERMVPVRLSEAL